MKGNTSVTTTSTGLATPGFYFMRFTDILGVVHDTNPRIEIVSQAPQITTVEPVIFRTSEVFKMTVTFNRNLNDQFFTGAFLTKNEFENINLTISINSSDSIVVSTSSFLTEGLYSLKINLCNTQITYSTQIRILKTIDLTSLSCPIGSVLNNLNVCVSCKDENQKYYDGKCVETCPSNTFLHDGYICVLSCEVVSLYSFNGGCVQFCPGDYAPGPNNICYNCADLGQYYLDNRCVSGCPLDYTLVASTKTCLKYVNIFEDRKNKFYF
jgi:hypothetical protein